MTEETSPKVSTKSTVEQVLELMKRESELQAELAQITKKKLFYKDEISQVKGMMHTTWEWVHMLVSQMTDIHLINTVSRYTRHKWLESVPKRYIDEVKKRDLIDNVLNEWTRKWDWLDDFFDANDYEEDDDDEYGSWISISTKDMRLWV